VYISPPSKDFKDQLIDGILEWKIYIGAGLGGLIIMIVLLCCWCRRKAKKPERPQQPQQQAKFAAETELAQITGEAGLSPPSPSGII